MKKILLILVVFVIAGCTAGELKENRRRLYEMNSDKEICEKHPERCISGVSW